MTHSQLDLVDAATSLANGPFIGTGHRRRMDALLSGFHRGGLALSVCADQKHLGRKIGTLKAYARRLKLAFPDYVPMALRPPKPPKQKRQRR